MKNAHAQIYRETNHCLSRLVVAVFTGSVAMAGLAQGGGEAPRQIEEVIVKGQKRDQSLRDVNASVAVFTGETLQNMTFTDVSELYQFTPNVQNTVDGEGEFSIRGINFRGENLSESGNLASMYVDGIFQSTLGIEAGPTGIYDVDQVEIYRGVQSTIQGRNSLAGAVVIRTADPTYEWTAKARAEYAEYGTRRVAAAFGGPVLEDQLAFRVSVDDFETDGFIENPAAGIDTINFDDSRNIRAKVLFEPDALPGFSALLTYVEAEGIAGTGFGTGVVNGPDFFHRQVNDGITNPGLLNIESENFALTLRQEISESLTVEWIGTTSEAKEDSEPRFEAFDLDVFFDFANDEENVDTSDLRLLWNGDRLSLVGGLYYFEQDRARTRDLGFFSPGFDFWFVQGEEQEIENKAIYFDGEYDFGNSWTLLFGARYDDEEYRNAGFVQQSLTGPIDPSTLARSDSSTDYDAFLPKLGIRWDQNDDISWSFVVQRGYRAGGAAIDGDNVAYEFDPEYTTNYELALRSTWLDGRMSLNANAFYVDWDDQQVILTLGQTGVLSRIGNAGQSELYGFEVDFTALLTERLTLIGGAGFLHTEFKDFVNQATGQDFAGNSFGQAPEQTFSLGLFYEHGNGVYASIDGRYQSESFSDAENFREHEVDAYFVANAKAGYRAEHWSAGVFARNLFDEDYLLRIRNVVQNPDNPSIWEANVGAPQVIGAEVTLNF